MLAQKLDLSKRHLSAIEAGKEFVSVSRVARFADVLGYPVQQFVLASLQDELNEAGIDLTFDLKHII
jgi:transcriptional regulator with XRE-family HTH domain